MRRIPSVEAAEVTHLAAIVQVEREPMKWGEDDSASAIVGKIFIFIVLFVLLFALLLKLVLRMRM